MTTTSKELFMAILTMDSYNRGYNAKITGLSENLTTQIGDVTILANSTLSLGVATQSESFYAVAYNYNGETVISYRGTDASRDLDDWLGGAGVLTDQAKMAAQFYDAVIGGANTNPYNYEVTFTGHSLGGGLAGLMADLYHKKAYLFDYMPFQDSADNTAGYANDPNIYQTYYFNNAVPTLPNSGLIKGYSTTGEVLSWTRYLDSINDHEYDSHGGARHPFDLHSQALLVSLMYADKNELTDWVAVGTPFMNALFDDAIAQSFKGINADVMLGKIAYTAIESGVQPFGNAAIHAMFNDANDLGKLFQPANAEYLLEVWKAPLANILVQYAGQLAENAVVASAGNQNVEILQGVLEVSANTELLTVDLSDETWTFGQNSTAQENIIGREQLTDLVFLAVAMENGNGVYTGVKENVSEIWEGFAYDDVDQIALISRNYGVDITLAESDITSEYTFILGGYGSDNIIGAQGKNLIFGSVGNDTLTGGGDSDIIYGGRDNNTINGGGGADFINGGFGADSLNGGTGYDTYIFNSGDGHDVISDAASKSYFFAPHVNTLRFGEGIEAEDIIFVHNFVSQGAITKPSNDLILRINGGEDSIKLRGEDNSIIIENTIALFGAHSAYNYTQKL